MAPRTIVLILVLLLGPFPALPAGAQEEAPPPEAPATTREERARSLLREFDGERRHLQELIDSNRGVDREAFELLKVDALAVVNRFDELNEEIADVLARLDPAADVTDSLRRAFGRNLDFQLQTYNASIANTRERMADLRDQRVGATPNELSPLESEIAAEQELVTRLLTLGTRVAEHLEALELPPPRSLREFDLGLASRAERLVGRLKLAALERDRIEDRLKRAEKAGTSAEDLADDRNRLRAMQLRLSGLVSSLEGTADLLETRGEDVSRYRQLVIRTTGELTGRIADPKVLWGLLKNALGEMWSWIQERGPTWIVRLVILVAAVLLTRLLVRVAWFFIRRHPRGGSRSSRLLVDLITRMIMPIATVLGLLIGFWLIGANPATLLAGVGVAGVIVGLALQDSLSNLAAGLFILVYRPYDVDEVVSAGGVVGRVRAMGLANTTIVTFDNRRLYVPNRKIWQEVIENRSVEMRRRVEITIRIRYDDDLDGAIEVIRGILAEHELVLEEPRPDVFVQSLEDSWVQLSVWPWASTARWWDAVMELPRVLRTGLTAAGYHVPYPHHEIEVARPEPTRAEDAGD
jgi:small conductance mechanosensitive channel